MLELFEKQTRTSLYVLRYKAILMSYIRKCYIYVNFMQMMENYNEGNMQNFSNTRFFFPPVVTVVVIVVVVDVL